jgi:uncharacterized membrane protein (UPF0182 family)
MLSIVLIVFIGLVSLGYITTRFLPDYYWFDTMNAVPVWMTQMGYKIGVFVAVFTLVFGWFLLNHAICQMVIKRASRVIPEPDYAPWVTGLRRWFRVFMQPYRSLQMVSRSVRLLIMGGVAGLIAASSGGYWMAVAAMMHAQPFQVTDPIFQRDIGFYVFTYPVIGPAIGVGLLLIVATLAYSLWRYALNRVLPAIHYTGFIGLRAHIVGLLTGLFALLGLGAYYKKFDILWYQTDVLVGASYTDYHVYLAVIQWLPVLWGALAFVTLAQIPRLRVKPIGWGLIGVAVVILLGQHMMPALIQSYVVAPNELKKETPFIEHNIHYTKMAYNLNNIADIAVPYKKTIDWQNIPDLNPVLSNARLWNVEPLQSTLKQLQEIRLYYEFKSVDVDRYRIQGEPQQVMVSVRELDTDQLSTQAQTWVNRHLIFTHGYGVCMVPVNRVNPEGLPEFLIRDIPPVSAHKALQITRPEIYFGEATQTYAIVNTHQEEFDYPKDNQNRYTHYQGTGGVVLDSWFKRLVFSLALKDVKLMISRTIHAKSRLLFDRDIHTIPQKIAPFIVFDRDPYPVVAQGRLVWVIDGYTRTSYYPYATPYAGSTNYIRNAVVTTIDAYSGETLFYVKDATDPIIQTYGAIYPQLFRDLSTMPLDLQQHLRFPTDLFTITASIYNTYHMTDPQVFYNKEDLWTFPTETYDADTGMVMTPYSMYMTHAAGDPLDYVTVMPLTPSKKNNLVSLLTVSNEPGTLGQLRVYKYPKQETVYGPLQIESRIDQDTDISKDLTLWGQVGSRVIRGHLMVIPFNNTLVYVEPIYLQATQSQLPELKRVIVAAGDQVVMRSSIQEGIAALVEASPKPTAPSMGHENNLTKKIQDTYSKVKDSVKNANWVEFGRYLDQLGAAIERLKKEE